jgi:hypothetical protein
MPRKLRIGYSRPYRMPADRGTYTLSGQAAAQKYGRLMSAAQGSYAIAGQDATLTADTVEGVLTTTFRVNSVTGGTNLPFAFGHVFAEGDVPGGQVAIGSGGTDWQCSPMTYWPDGSLRHAIIAGRATCTAGTDKVLTLTAGASPGGTALTEAGLASALPTTTIAAGAFTWTLNSSVSTSDLHRTVCTGPVMSNFIYRKAVTGSNHLVLWADVRVYIGGNVEVFPWVENAYFLQASPANDVRTYTVTIGGVQRFTQSIDVKHHTRVPLLNASSPVSFSYWTGTDPQIVPKHDSQYLRDSKMVPNYSGVTPSSTTLNALQQTYTPNTLAGVDSSMGVAGTSTAILNRPDAAYVITGDARAWKAATVFALSGGSWSSHYRSEITNEPFSFSTYPNASLQGQVSPTVPEGTGGANGTHVTSHQPSYGYLTWLLSGRWWFLDEMLLWGGWNYLWQNVTPRGGANGVFCTNEGSNTDRGAAWALRTLAQGLAALPTSHPLYTERKTSWEANMAFYATGNSNSNGGIGVNTLGVQGFYGLFSTTSVYATGNSSTNMYGAGWMQNMFHGVMGFTWDLSLLQSSTSQTNHQTVRDFGYTMPVMLAGDGLGNNWSYRNFTVLELNWGVMGGTYYSSWDGAYAIYKTGRSISLPAGTDLYYGPTAFADGGSMFPYFGQALTALAYAVEHGKVGAAEGWNRVTNASNFSTIMATTNSNNSMQTEFVYAIAPRLPAWRSGQAVNEWREISSTSLSSVTTYNYGASNAPQGKQDAWIGWHIDTRTSKVYSVANGGHDDYWGNEVDAIDLQADAPAWSEVLASSSQANVTSASNYYSDGRPASHHSYFSNVFIEAHNRAMMFPGQSRSKDGNGTNSFAAFNTATGAYDAASVWSSLTGAMSIGGTGPVTCVKHPTTEDVYVLSGNAGLYKWTKGVPGSISTLISFPSTNPYYTAAAVDTSRNRILFLGGGLADQSYVYDITANTITNVTLSDASLASDEGLGLVYVPAIDKFVCRKSTTGGTVYVIDPATWAVTTPTTTGGASMTAGGAGSGGNPFTKFLYVPRLGGVVYGPKWGQNLWFLRLH